MCSGFLFLKTENIAITELVALLPVVTTSTQSKKILFSYFLFEEGRRYNIRTGLKRYCWLGLG